MFRIEFSTENDAFADEGASEVARILREIADRVERGQGGGTVRDYNGNTVGQWSATLD